MAARALSITGLAGPIAELAVQTIQGYLTDRDAHVKCGTCKDFFVPSSIGKTVHVAECTTCNHTAAFCNGCGGEARALKSIRFHVQYYMREVSVDWYGVQHETAWLSYTRTLNNDTIAKKKFGVVNGGRL